MFPEVDRGGDGTDTLQMEVSESEYRETTEHSWTLVLASFVHSQTGI